MSQQSSLESIFSVALEKRSAEERAAYLNDACGGNDDLRRQVERLLDAVPKLGSFMGKPIVPTVDEPAPGRKVATAKAAKTLVPAPISEGPGTLGAAIRERRKAQGLTLAQMAQRTGVSLGYLSQIELGKSAASVETLYRVSLGLGVRLADLFQAIQPPS